jgi:Fanconi anemia group M protein
MGAFVRVSQLGVADYLVGDEIGVERKAVLDLHHSIHNRRLWSQLRGYRLRLKRLYLLVEGRKLDDGPVGAAGIRGALLEIGDRGVTVIRATDTIDSARWILRLAVRAQRRGSVPNARPRRYRPATSAGGIVAVIPGIGPRTAQRLVSEFGSVAEIAAATPDDLCRVHGVGPTLASRIHDALSRT